MRHIGLFMIIPLLITACGKKGALIYPEMLVAAAPISFTARQAGQNMKLSFDLPQKDRAGRNLKNLSGIKILKREAPAGQGAGCSACTSDFTLFRTLYLDVPDEVQRYGNLLVLLDGDVKSEREYTYRAVAFTKDGVEGEMTAPFLTTMVQSPPPPVLKIIPAPTEIRVEFEKKMPVMGIFEGYNLYRAVKGEAFPYLPLNGKPFVANSFVDTGLDRSVVYTYVGRTVIRMPSKELVESGPSNKVEAALKEEE